MRILAVEHTPTTERGGSERSYFDVLSGLVSRGHEVVLLYEQPGNLLDRYIASGVHVVQCELPFVPPSGRRLQDLRVLWHTSKLALAHGPFDLVYVNFTEALPLAVLVKMRTGAPVVCHIRIPYYGLTRLILFAGRFVSKLIVINNRQKEVFESVFSARGKVSVVYNGLPIPGDLPPVKKGRENGDMRVLYIGRIAPEKGVSELVKAFAVAVGHGLKARLQITGSYVASHSGDYRSELAEVISQSGVSSLIDIHPSVDDPITYMSRFDLTVLPATWDEAFGRTVPESILAGTPVLARNVGMIEEIMVSNPQFMFNTDDMLATKLMDFYGGNLSFNFEAARDWIADKFNKARMIEQVETELLEVFRKSNR